MAGPPNASVIAHDGTVEAAPPEERGSPRGATSEHDGNQQVEYLPAVAARTMAGTRHAPFTILFMNDFPHEVVCSAVTDGQ